MCSNFILFLQEEKDTVGMSTNVIVLLQEEKDTVDIWWRIRLCNNFKLFRQLEK